MKKLWWKIEKRTARKSARNRYSLARGRERCFKKFEEIAKNKMRKNHESVCPLILVFPFEIQKQILKKRDERIVVENCLFMIDDRRQARFLFGYFSWAEKTLCYNTLLDKDMLKFVRLLVEPNLTLVKAVTTASQIESAINNAKMSLLPKRFLAQLVGENNIFHVIRSRRRRGHCLLYV